MECHNQEEKAEVPWSLNETWQANYSQTLFEPLQPSRRREGRPSLTWMKLIEKDLDLIDIKLNSMDKRTPKEKIEGLVEDKQIYNGENWWRTMSI